MTQPDDSNDAALRLRAVTSKMSPHDAAILETLYETMVHEFAHAVVARVGGLTTNYITVQTADNAASEISGIIDPTTRDLNQTRLPLIARIAVAGVTGESLLRTDDPVPAEIIETLRVHNHKGDSYYIDVQNLEKALGAPLADAVPETVALIREAIANLKPRMRAICQVALDVAEWDALAHPFLPCRVPERFLKKAMDLH